MAALLRKASFVLWGSSAFTSKGYETAARKFDNSRMQLSNSLAGKVVIVTGANAGLGLEVSQELASRGASLWMLCRNEQRGRAAAEQVKASSGNSDVHLAVCDVSSLSSVAAFCAEWLRSGRPLHVLVNNAGVLLQERSLTPEGHEASFATNLLGTAALTRRLLPALAAGAPSRVIFVSSGGQYTQPLQLGDLQHSRLVPWDGTVAYSRDKRRQVALAEHLARTWAPQGVAVYSMHPGWADTPGVRTSIPDFHAAFKAKLRTPAQGADTIVWLAVEEGGALQPGALYLDRARQPKDLTLALGTRYSEADAGRLYEQLMALAGLPGGGDGAAGGGEDGGGGSGGGSGGGGGPAASGAGPAAAGAGQAVAAAAAAAAAATT